MNVKKTCKCNLCGAEGVQKGTCPFNPLAKNPKPGKHNKFTNSKFSMLPIDFLKLQSNMVLKNIKNIRKSFDEYLESPHAYSEEFYDEKVEQYTKLLEDMRNDFHEIELEIMRQLTYNKNVGAGAGAGAGN